MLQNNGKEETEITSKQPQKKRSTIIRIDDTDYVNPFRSMQEASKPSSTQSPQKMNQNVVPLTKSKSRPRRYRGAEDIISNKMKKEILNNYSSCSVIPSQVGKNSISLDVNIDIKNGYDTDDKKEDAIMYVLEIFIKNEWKIISQKSSDEPSIIFRIDGLQHRPYKIRIKYVFFQMNKKYERYSDEVWFYSLGCIL